MGANKGNGGGPANPLGNAWRCGSQTVRGGRARILDLVTGSTTPCMFCGQTGRKLTKEDVIPVWLWRVFREGRGMSGPVSLSANGRTLLSGDRLRIRYGGICDGCNNGWMHAMEADARPLLRPAITGEALGPGKEILLDRGAQAAVATWALKTWLLIQLSTHFATGSSVRSPDALRYLYAHHEPPDGVFVHIATMHLPPTVAMDFRVSRLTDEQTGRYGVLALMTFGRLGLSVTMPETEGIVTLPDGEPELEMALSQIWPYKVPEVRWPTSRALTEAAIDHLYPPDGITFRG